jgi:predicted Zn-dependent protease
MLRVLFRAPALVALVALAACSTVPGTGRHQLLVTSVNEELELGEEGYAEALKGAKLVTSGPQYEMVQRVGHAIAQAATDLPDYAERCKDFEWEVALIDEPKTINAWCMPGGKIAVYTGLLPVTQDEASLAIVVGHEVGHAVARHGGERMSQELAVQLGLGIAAVSMGDMSQEQKDGVMTALVGVGTYGVLAPFSRAQESEADEIGLYIAAWAGYDPRAAIGLWTRMGQMGGDKPPEILSTHPSDEHRLEHMQELMPKALKKYEAGQKQHSGASKKTPQMFSP